MKYFVILLVLVGFVFTSNLISDGFSLCAVNEDWENAPCYDMGPITKEQFRADWAPYYDYKGKYWMELKRYEMEQAIQNNSLEEWVQDHANSNVYSYYVSTGEIQKQSSAYVPTFKHETWSYKLEILIIALPIIGGSVLGYYKIKQKRK